MSIQKVQQALFSAGSETLTFSANDMAVWDRLGLNNEGGNHVKKDIGRAIDYAVKSNELEGLVLAEDDKALLEQVRAGKVALEEYQKAIVIKYNAIGSGKPMTAEEALALLKAGQDGA